MTRRHLGRNPMADAGGCLVNPVLLHLAAAVVKRRCPTLFLELAEHLASRHPKAASQWRKALEKHNDLFGERCDMVSLLLASELAKRRGKICVADPESGSMPVGFAVSPYEDGVFIEWAGSRKPAMRVSSLALLAEDEELLLYPGESPLRLSYEVEPAPVLRLTGLPVMTCGTGLTDRCDAAQGELLRLERGALSKTTITLPAEVSGTDLLLRLSPEAMVYMLASEDGCLKVTHNGTSWHSRLPAPGDDVPAVVGALGGRAGASTVISTDIFRALRVHCPWFGSLDPDPLIAQALRKVAARADETWADETEASRNEPC